MARLSAVIDGALIEANGFGFLDLLEASLRYSDERLTTLRPLWSGVGLARDDEAPSDESLHARAVRIQHAPTAVTQAEVLEWELHQNARPWVAACRDPDRAGLAWDWATRDISQTRWKLGIDTSIFGSALAFRQGNETMPLPTAFILGSLCNALGELSAEISPSGPYELVIRKAVEAVALRAIGGAAPQAPEGEEEHLSWLASSDVVMVCPSRRNAVTVGFAAGLTFDQLHSSIAVASDQLAAFATNLPEGAPERDPDAIVSQLIVYGGPIQINPRYGAGPLAIHVEEFVDMLFEARQIERGDDVGGVLWWQFVEEATLLPGVREVLPTDIGNVWHHWIRNGVLNAGGLLDVSLFAPPEVDDHRWSTDATWEVFEDLLFAAGLPPRALWPVAVLVEAGREAIVGDSDIQWTVSTAPPIVIGAIPVDSPQETLIDQAAASSIADGVLLTIRGNSILREAFTGEGDVPVLLAIQLGLQESGGPSGISLEEVELPCPGTIVVLEPSWQRLLALQPQSAHEALGDVLCGWIGEVSDGAVDVEALKRAWSTTAPVMLLRPIEGSPVPRQPGSIHLPRNVVSRGKAMQIVAREVLTHCQGPVIATGEEAVRLATSELIPLVSRVLVNFVNSWSPSSIADVAEHLNDAFAERYRVETEIGLALSAPWADTWRERALMMEDPAESTRSLDLLFETLLAADVQGSTTPDQFDIAIAAELADLLFGIGAGAWGAIRGMHDLAAAISPDGMIMTRAMASDKVAGFGSPGRPKDLEVDVASYHRAVRAHELICRVSEEGPSEEDDWFERAKSGSTTIEDFQTLDSLGATGRFREADQALREAVGTGLEGIAAVLGTASDLDASDESVSVIEPGTLIDEAVKWSGLDVDVVEAAVGLLTLSGRSLVDEGAPFWEQETRQFRLATRPLVQMPSGGLLVIPWRVRGSQQVFTTYLLNGSVPWHRSHLPEAVDEAFNRYRQGLNRGLERLAEQVAIDLRFKCLRNVSLEQANRAGLGIGGEIDLLVVDVDRQRIWVCEVKDPIAGFSSKTMRRRIQRFKGESGHEAQLRDRTSEVSVGRQAACRLLGVDERTAPWDVTPLMITRRPEPAAFVTGTSTAYAVIEQLPEVWHADTPNWSGHFPFEAA